MSDNKLTSQANIGSLLISAFFVIAGVVTLYDTTTYADVDSKVFPQAVATVLIICATIALIINFLKPASGNGFGTGDWWRRALLIAAMLAACFAMPYVGFMLAGGIAFAGGLIAAMHNKWSIQTVALYWISGAVIIAAFYGLFRYILLVPLP